jgi:hypothetical protein
MSTVLGEEFVSQNIPLNPTQSTAMYLGSLLITYARHYALTGKPLGPGLLELKGEVINVVNNNLRKTGTGVDLESLYAMFVLGAPVVCLTTTHLHEGYAYEGHAYGRHTYGRHTYERHTYERHTYERHAHERHIYERHIYERHAHRMHAHERHTHEMHAMRGTSMRGTPTRGTPIECAPMRGTPMECTSIRDTPREAHL